MTTATMESTVHHDGGKALHLALWAGQLLLAAAFGMAGVMKLFTPLSELAQTLPWVADMGALARFIGATEIAAAFGLVLPAVTRVKPALVPLAAAGLATIMVLASAFHLSRGEADALPVNLGLLALAVFVAWGRAKKAPIHAR